MKKVLITGANSYIGTSFEQYVKDHYVADLEVHTIDMIDGSWRQKDFSDYDVVFHVAGLAHADVGKVTEEIKKKYYSVNTDLAIETCKKAKNDGVKQFVFMSSAIIYGDSAPFGKKKVITRETEPQPANFYGDSKWQADKGVRGLADENFIVTVLRPPMIYGKGSKGNYPVLAKMAKKLPVFPDVDNERSMLYIENLCEFLCQVIVRGEGGIFWPQNAEYTKTSCMVKMIAEAVDHKIVVSRAFYFGIRIAVAVPGKARGLTNKAFGNLSYDHVMSQYDFKYQLYDLRTSIERTEST
nr:NAD-dependent epimerase/dehydratase family protein [uncultured Butyrivibrio sp.]